MSNAKVSLPVILVLGIVILQTQAHADSSARGTILTALLGAGTGAISAEASGGKAGTGALVGAGTGVIGTALIDLLAAPSTGQGYTGYSTYHYTQPEPVYVPRPVQTYNYVPQPTYSQPMYYSTPVTYSSSTNDNSRNVIKNGLMGAATGAIASEVSDGKAGKGALVGAGTQVIGSALFDLFFPAQPVQTPQPVYAAPYPQVPANYFSSKSSTNTPKKIVRIYDKNGQLISEEEYTI